MSSYERVVALAGSEPDVLLLDARQCAELHVALAVGALSNQEATTAIPALLDGPVTLRRPTHTLARMRILDACHAIAVAACASELSEEDGELFARVSQLLLNLSVDRNATVATPAAAALAAMALAAGEGSNERTKMGSLEITSEGILQRRTAVARAIQWLFGDGANEPLKSTLPSLDAYATAEVIRALARWRVVAPATADGAALELGHTTTATVLHALGDYALALPDKEERQPRIQRVCERAAKIEAPDPVLELWRGRPGERARQLLLGWADLRSLCTTGLDAAAAPAQAVFRSIEDAIGRIEESERGPAVDALQLTLDTVLLSSPLLHDVLVATSESDAEALSRRRSWEAAVVRLRANRFEQLRRDGGGKYETREAIRRVAHVVDATHALAEPPAGDPASAKAIVARLRDMMSESEEQMLDRPLARAFAQVVERATPNAPQVEMLGLVLSFKAEPFRKYADEFAGGKLVLTARALLQLKQALDATQRALKSQNPGARGRRKLAKALLPALREVSVKASTLTDHDIVRGLDDLVGVAIHVLHQRRPSGSVGGVIADAIDKLLSGMRQAAAVVQDDLPPTLHNAAIQRRVEELIEKPSSKAGTEAKRELERILPPILAGCLDVIIALQGALDSEPDPPPEFIGDYHVVRALGAGGMGACLLVRSRSKEDLRHYVLKLPQRTSSVYRTWFRREALALLSLADHPHPGIVRFVAFHDGLAGKPHLVMEWVDGVSLESRISKAPLPVAEALAITADLAAAIAHSHAHRIGHYDVKPANVVLYENQPVLVDWGIAGATCKNRVGTPNYMAPERYAHEEIARPEASDVFSLGCLLPEMLGGKRLIAAEWTDEDERLDPGFLDWLKNLERPSGAEGAIYARLHDNRRVLEGRLDRLLGPFCPPYIRGLVSRMVDRDPWKRPSAAEVEKGIRALL